MAIELDRHYPGFARIQLFSGQRPALARQADPSLYLGTLYLAPAVLEPKSPRQDRPAKKRPG